MKKIILLLTIASLMDSYSLMAQMNPALPNNGLSHIKSQEEILHSNEIGKGFFPTAMPTKPVRNIAEFEPSEAAIISYVSGFGLPYTFIKELAKDIKVIIVVTSQSQANSVTTTLQSNGVNTANCQFLISAIDSWWARDYTGWFIADGNNKVGIVDFVYNRPRPNDDAIPGKEAQFLNIQSYAMNVTHTGGNYMCDGMGIATSTDLVWDENTITHAQINQNMLDYLGISNYMVIQDPQGQYIKHMDCFGKFLAVDKILIDSVPASDPQFNAYQATAAYYRNTNCSYGYKYKVYRPYTSGSANGEPYSNSFISNNKVFIALKGTANDNAALNTYKQAMPGYTVTGYLESPGAPWESTDALHCRVHEIADRKMLYINHMPLFGKVCSSTGYKISTDVVSYDAQAVKAGYPMIMYRINSNPWDSISMTLISANKFEGTIPFQSNGTAVQYYIKAIDNSNKIAFHPFIGAADPHTFTAECLTGIQSEIAPETYFNTYPNPNNGDFYVYLDSKRACTSNIKISNMLGETVYNDTYDLNSGISLKHIVLSNIGKGVYMIEYSTNFETITQKIVIQ
jgi:agmatine/peptidylarginine deiminase